MAGDEISRILGTGGPLEHRFGQIAGLRRETQQRPEDKPGCDRLAEADDDRRDSRSAGDEAADQPGIRLRR